MHPAIADFKNNQNEDFENKQKLWVTLRIISATIMATSVERAAGTEDNDIARCFEGNDR